MHLVMMETDADNEDERQDFQSSNMSLGGKTHQFWVPFVRRTMAGQPFHQLLPDGERLAAAAAATGGALHRAALLSVPSSAGTLKQALDDFRQTYVLRYTARGVARDGWHRIDVSVPSQPSAKVRARRGYGVGASIDPASGPATPAAAPPAGRLPATLEQFVNAYGPGDYTDADRGFMQLANPTELIRKLRDEGNPWPGAPRREAAFVLQLAETGIFAPRTDARDAARRLLTEYAPLVRQPLEPDAFERYWLWAVLTMLEGAIRPAVSQPFAALALERFPDEPRFVLAAAIVADQQWPLGTWKPDTGAKPIATHAADVVSRYEAAIAFPGAAAEARVRLAWLLHRTGRDAEALTHLENDLNLAAADVDVRYLRDLFLGHVLSALDRRTDAVAAYRRAMAIAPGAQSARVALMNTLLFRGERAEALALADVVQTADGQAVDPWARYWQGDLRFYRAALSRVREMAR
jgi:tetratricopeptide (TPR) repeat protein